MPCGATALEIAEAAGVTLKPVSEEQKVTDVRGKVSSGEADAALALALVLIVVAALTVAVTGWFSRRTVRRRAS